MSITVSTLRAAGLSADQIVKVLEVEQEQRLSAQREGNRIRQRNHRSRNDVTRDHCDQRDMRDAPSNPPPCITPLNTPQGSEAKASASDDANVTILDEDPKAKLYRIGKTMLVSFGIPEKRTGALIGQWLKSRSDPVGLLAAIQFARDQNVAEPIAYISALLNGKSANGRPNFKPDPSARALQLAGEIRARERAAGIGRQDDVFGGDGPGEPIDFGISQRFTRQS